MKFISNSPVVHLSTNTYPQLPNPTVVSISQNLVFALNRWNVTYNREFQFGKNLQMHFQKLLPNRQAL
jgi:hypothetical protein